HEGDFAVLYRTNSQSRAIEDALRRKDIPYRIYGGLSFYQRKEIKDVLAYLRLILNPKDEEALIRVINFPSRGIGQTTVEKLTVAANHYKRSIFEVMENLDKIDLKLHSGTKKRLDDFITMIKSFQVTSQSLDAFELTAQVVKNTGLFQLIKRDGTAEGITRMENVEELLNGIQDFVEGQDELADATGSIAAFMEEVALVADLDNATGDDDRVALMTIHLAKGLEFTYVFSVGLEEDLFPSAMSMNTRSELEEERRLFYVALTRAEKQAYLTYALSRYRWGKLVDSEPSRFIEEIDDTYLEILTPPEELRFNPMLDADIFGDATPGESRSADANKIRFKPAKKIDFSKGKPVKEETTKFQVTTPKNLKPVSQTNGNANLFDSKLVVGNVVKHIRFGTGKVLKIEGAGADTKAEIDFQHGGVKKLLLRFAKLEVIG